MSQPSLPEFGNPFFWSVRLSRSAAERTASAVKMRSDKTADGTNGSGMEAAGRTLLRNQCRFDAWKGAHSSIDTSCKPTEDVPRACHDVLQ
jgi:hypothetical protein